MKGHDEPGGRRPEILNLVVISSFILSVLGVIWVAFVGLLALVAGGVSWLGGPIVGAAVSTIAAIVILYALVHSALSLLLFLAAWKTRAGDPGGRSLHLTWAWIIVVLDVIDLAFTWGMEPGAWVRLIYALALLWIMNQDRIRAYFAGTGVTPYAHAGKPAAFDDEWR